MLNNTKTQFHPKLLFLVPAISQTHKSLENSQDFFCQDQDQDQDQDFIFFVLEAPRDQDFGLEDYITECLSRDKSALTFTTFPGNPLYVDRRKEINN